MSAWHLIAAALGLGSVVVIAAGASTSTSTRKPEPGPEPKPEPKPKPTPGGGPPGAPVLWRPPIAFGDPSPAWPLDDAARTITDDLGDCRPRAACARGMGRRNHAGEDLPAPRFTVVRAPEAGTIVVARPRWYEGTGLLLLQTDTGLVINLGEIEPDSEREFKIAVGSRVAKAQDLARVGRHGMIHFETYVDRTRLTSQWLAGEPAPATLLDPIPYLRLAAESGL